MLEFITGINCGRVPLSKLNLLVPFSFRSSDTSLEGKNVTLVAAVGSDENGSREVFLCIYSFYTEVIGSFRGLPLGFKSAGIVGWKS